MKPSDRYTYADAGFNGFMSRSLKAVSVAQTLSDGASTSSGTILNFDRQQVAASLGNILTLGRVSIDGVAGRIIVSDQNGVQTGWFGDLTP